MAERAHHTPAARSQVAYDLVVSRGYVRLVRRGPSPRPPSLVGTSFRREGGQWELAASADAEEQLGLLEDLVADGDTVDEEREDVAVDPFVAAAIDQAAHPGRGAAGQTARSRMNMRRLFMALPWELVGARPALISLTYPGVWQPWVPDGRVWEAHRRAFERRWVRRWKEPLVGVWVKEFQRSGRPHLHLYVGLPSTMSDDDFAELRERTLLRHRLEREHGRYEGRRRTPPLGLPYGGEFGRWVRDAWAEIVGTDQDRDGDDGDGGAADPGSHRLRGADVAVVFWSDQAAATTDRTVVAEYLAREVGKAGQKKPPAEFLHIGRFYGVWGKAVGFVPETTTTPLDPWVAAEVETRLARWVNWKLHVLRQGAPPANGLAVRRRLDGITALGMGPDQASRILRWSERAVARKQARPGTGPADGIAGPGGLEELLRVMNRLSSVEGNAQDTPNQDNGSPSRAPRPPAG